MLRLNVRKVWIFLLTGLLLTFISYPTLPAQSGESLPPPRPSADQIQFGNIHLPPGFQIEVYASGLPGARSMARSPNGTLYIGTRDENALYAIRDTNGDNVADQTFNISQRLNQLYGINLYHPNGVAFRNGSLYVMEVNRLIRLDDIENRLNNPLNPVVVNANFPSDWIHGWKFIRFGPDGRLYVPVGAPCNVCEANSPYNRLMRLNADGTGLETYATGIRNTVGFDWNPQTGELWFTENGRDEMGDNSPPDELNRAPVAGLNYGFPYCHAGTVPDPTYGSLHNCSEFTPPAINLGPHVAALGMRFYTGTMFPNEYHNQIFIAEHGSWNRSQPIGYRITLVRLQNNVPVSYEVFADGWLSGGGTSGRPVDVEVLPDGSMLVSDDFAGAIYRISYRSPGYSSSPVSGNNIQMATLQGANVNSNITVSESGNANLNVTGVSFAAGSSPQISVSGFNPFTINDGSGATQNIVVTCNAATVGTFTATLNVTHNGPNSPASYPITCNVTATPTAFYSSSPPAGQPITITQVVGQPATRNITVSENGTANLNVTGTSFVAGGSAQITVTGFSPFTIVDNSGQTQNITVTCNTAAIGSYSRTLQVAHNGSGSPATYAITCNVTSQPTPGYVSAPAPGAITLNTVRGVPATAEVVISQSGTADLNVTGVSFAAGGSPQIGVPGFNPFTIIAGSVQRVSVYITCTASELGTFTSTVRVAHNAPGNPASYPVTCNVTQPDTIAMFHAANNWVSLVNTLQNFPGVNSFTNYGAGITSVGQWVMGDWNNDGQKTPGVYANRAFYYTNSLGSTANWTGIWIGINGPPVAGRFSNAANDCIGALDQATLNGRVVFAMYYACNLTSGPTPPISSQWVSEVLPSTAGFSGNYQFVAGDYNGDGLDSIGVRRGPYIAFTTIAPSQGHAMFNLAQYIGTPSAIDYGLAVAGDWDNNNMDSFGLFYGNGDFYRRLDLEWNTGLYIFQRIGNPFGSGPLNVAAWRQIPGGSSGAPAVVIETTPVPTPTQTPEPTYVRRLIESDDKLVVTSGNWSSEDAESASGGNYLYSVDAPDAALTLEFVGTSVEVVYVQNPARGSFTIVIDETAVRTIQTDGDETSFDLTSVIDYLEPGPHTVRIVPIDGTVAIDAFYVTVPE